MRARTTFQEEDGERAGGGDPPLYARCHGSACGAVAACAFNIAVFSFAACGVLIALRQPHPIGWTLPAIGLVWEVPSVEIVRYGVVTAPGAVPGADVLAVLTASTWVPGIGLVGTFLLLLFPDGHLPSARWRPVAWASAVTVLVLTTVIPVLPMSLRDVATYDFLPASRTPLGVAALAPVGGLSGVAVLAVPLCIVACAASVVVRFRRARGVGRQQIKWLAAAAALTAVAYLTVVVLSLVHGAPWDDDAVRAVSGQERSSLAVAVSTLAVAGLFAPLRGGMQELIDRRCHDAQQAAAAFALRMRDRVDLSALGADLLAIVSTTIEPSTAWLWVRPRRTADVRR